MQSRQMRERLTGSRKEYRKRTLSTYGLFSMSIATAGSVMHTSCMQAHQTMSLMSHSHLS